MLFCVCVQALASIGFGSLMVFVFGAWIWSPLYIDWEETIVAIKERAAKVPQAVNAWFKAKFGKADKAPAQKPQSAAQQKVDVSMSTSLALKSKSFKQQPGSGATETTTNVTRRKGQASEGISLLGRIKGTYPIQKSTPPVC